VVIAVPVARPPTVDSLRREAEDVVAVVEPEPFLAVGVHSQDLPPPDDREIQRGF
jgi:putative phosphoribosyl transferase